MSDNAAFVFIVICVTLYLITVAVTDRRRSCECPQVRCYHCGTWGREGEDHSCTCPHSDTDCPDHWRPHD